MSFDMSTKAADSGIVYIPVPADRVLDVYRVLGELGSAAQPSGHPVMHRVPSEDSPWTAETIAQLYQDVRNVAVSSMLDLCAKKPGQWVSIREIEKATNLSMPKVRGSLAGFTMMLKSRFKTATWPVAGQWIDGSAAYRMSPGIAQLWLATHKA